MEEVIDLPFHDVVYIPSQSIDPEEIAKLFGFVYYEERPLLCSLLRLRNYPESRCVFVTSIQIEPQILSYYLKIASDGSPESEQSIRGRLLLLSVNDGSAFALTQKIIDKPEIINQIKEWIRPDKAFMRCIISTPIEKKLADLLAIPLRANPFELSHMGTKHGSRAIFKEANIPLADGTEEVYTVEKYIERILELWDRHPKHTKFVAKLNDGVSGDGNAIFRLQSDKSELSRDEKLKYIEDRLQNMEYVSKTEHWSSFASKLKKRGAIAEMWVEGNGATSPSSQGFIADEQKVFVLSTHEQVLEDGLYLGCHFPSGSSYREQLGTYCAKIGSVLANHGAKERFAVDYVVIPPQSDNPEEQAEIYAIEINLRSGGTTHPCETARLLCKGFYSGEQGLLVAHNKKEKYYQASDNVVDESFMRLSFDDIARIIEQSDSKWNKETMTGCVFYFLGALPSCGKVGMLAVGDTKEQSCVLFNNAKNALLNYAAGVVPTNKQ